jgi:hypothetical protein
MNYLDLLPDDLIENINKKLIELQNKERRKNYLTRSNGMKGNWKNNKYSANNLSIHVLW